MGGRGDSSSLGPYCDSFFLEVGRTRQSLKFPRALRISLHAGGRLMWHQCSPRREPRDQAGGDSDTTRDKGHVEVRTPVHVLEAEERATKKHRMY